MNKYPVWWDTTITVFNKYEDPQTQVVRWFSHTVDRCFWKYTGDKIKVGDTILESNSTICRIPKQDNFLERFEWEKQPNDKMEQYLTLGVGDIVIKGAVDDEVDEYTSGKRSADLIKKYKSLGCIEIESVSLNVGPGRCDEHYHIRGL